LWIPAKSVAAGSRYFRVSDGSLSSRHKLLVSACFAHRLSLQADVIGAARQAIQNGVVSRVAEVAVPFLHRQLAGDQGSMAERDSFSN